MESRARRATAMTGRQSWHASHRVLAWKSFQLWFGLPCPAAVEASTVPNARPFPFRRCCFALRRERLLCAPQYLAVQEIFAREKGPAMPTIDLGVRPLSSGNLGAEINSLQASRATAAEVRELQQILAK